VRQVSDESAVARPPDRAINEAVRRLASAGAGRQVAFEEVQYQVTPNGREVRIRVEGVEPDPLVYAPSSRILAIAREIAGEWN
jgi:hypothetical protein